MTCPLCRTEVKEVKPGTESCACGNLEFAAGAQMTQDRDGGDEQAAVSPGVVELERIWRLT